MIQIRKGVFETNSSSMHTIAISKDDLGWNDNFGDDKNLYIMGDDYGWSGPRLRYPEEKLGYFLSVIATFNDNDNIKEQKALILQDERFKILEKIVKDYTGKILRIKKNDYGEYGTVDHESLYNFNKYFEDEELLKELIFNKRYSILIMNDNTGDAYPHLIKDGDCQYSRLHIDNDILSEKVPYPEEMFRISYDYNTDDAADILLRSPGQKLALIMQILYSEELFPQFNHRLTDRENLKNHYPAILEFIDSHSWSVKEYSFTDGNVSYSISPLDTSDNFLNGYIEVTENNKESLLEILNSAEENPQNFFMNTNDAVSIHKISLKHTFSTGLL